MIPFDDPTLMFANAGMNQFKDIFTGQKQAEYPRAVTVQKCMRAGGKHNDLENVGRTARHNTFFEMLGNFSFGDYFKEEAIFYAWEWITKDLKLLKDKLYVSVYKDDDEAYKLWEKIAPELKNGRILRFDAKENYWSMGETGPNGPCSEIHFDRGEKYGKGPEYRVNGAGDRFVEFWNLVFMQYNTKADGTTELLPHPSVDTGAGLERIACILQKADSNYETDSFQTIIQHTVEICGKKYYSDERGVSHRVIADHIRALTFCIADGGGPANEGAGYVLRRILRRAARHGRLLDLQEPFLFKLVPTLVDLMGENYPEVKNRQQHIEKVIRAEEESFGQTLDTGLELFDNVSKKILSSGCKVVPGDEIFKLYDTYGFPVDMTQLMAEEKGLTLDMAGFEKNMQKQQESSRSATRLGDERKEQFQQILDEILKQVPAEKLKTEFIRDTFELESPINEIVELEGDAETLLVIIPERTPFYIESGGQIDDYGKIESKYFKADVEYLVKYNEALVHIARITQKNYDNFEDLGDIVATFSIDKSRRLAIMRNHTATHLLHAALRIVLGEHVRQAGSYVGPDKLRFDFSHFEPMTAEQINRVEHIVNGRILRGGRVATEDMDIDAAKKTGAMAIFGEKYGRRVRVVSVDDFSKELCGGTHVDNISSIGPFMILLESGIASGVRRIEAVTGHVAVETMLEQKKILEKISQTINRPADEVVATVSEMISKNIELQKENKKLKSEKFSGSRAIGEEIVVNGITLRFNDFGSTDSDEMAGWIDDGKGSGQALVCIGLGIVDNKKICMSSASSSANIHIGKFSGELLKLLGGRGGGKQNFARGSLPDNVTAEKLFKAAEEGLKKFINGG